MTHLKRLLGCLVLAASAVGCGNATCIDVGANYHVLRIAYAETAPRLFLSGSQRIGGCFEDYEPGDLDDHNILTGLTVDLLAMTEASTRKIGATRQAFLPEPPADFTTLFAGEFVAPCVRCLLQVGSRDGLYLVQVFGDLAAFPAAFAEANGILAVEISRAGEVVRRYSYGSDGFAAVE